jgi:hypothetical protein
MKKTELELYTDYLISTFGSATATGVSAMVDGDVSHDRVTRFLSERAYTSKDLWLQVKSTVRQIEGDDGVLIFDDTIQVMCQHISGHKVKQLYAAIQNPRVIYNH